MNLTNIIKGILIGVALVIPGLSGSIFAVVVGLYEDILNAINNLKTDFKKSIIFLLPIGIGGIIGILISTKAVLFITTNYPVWSYLFFVGLVLGSLPLVFNKMKTIDYNPKYLIITVLSFIIIYIITLIGDSSGDKSSIALTNMDGLSDFLTMVFAGVFSVSLMGIPGVSGSVMLMVINQYGTVYNAVAKSTDLIRALIKGDMGMFRETFSTVSLMIPFVIGALIGLIFIAKIMGYLLEKFEALVYYGVLGVIIAAIVTLLKEGVIYNIKYLPMTHWYIIIPFGIICIVAGYLATIFLDREVD